MSKNDIHLISFTQSGIVVSGSSITVMIFMLQNFLLGLHLVDDSLITIFHVKCA